jgi:two-component system nitrogen regulation sensor histidine kinase NtrY
MNNDITLKIVLLFVIALTAVALLSLIFLVFKNLFRLYVENRNRVLGYRFRTKVVAIFVVIVLIPTVMLFFVASGLITTYIDHWLSPNIKEPVELSFEIAKTLYEREMQRTLQEARRALRGQKIPETFKVRRLYKLPENASETLKEAFMGKEGVEVITTGEGDIIRAVVPIKRGKKVRGVLIVEEILPLSIVSQAEQIRTSYQHYISLYRVKLPLKLNYILALGFFTLLIIFTALWASIKISKWISDPVQRLAHATEAVAKGDLNIKIDLKRDDEFGLLVNSFNKMVEELKESKKSLEEAYIESDRRRACLENMLEGINSGVVSVDSRGRVLTVNHAAMRILGIKEEDVINGSYEVLLKNVDSEELKDFIKNIRIREFTTVTREFKVKINGKGVILRTFITQLRDRENKPIGLLVVFDDITELLKAKQALMWQEVARNIAHEIKNPLTPIKLSTERLLKKWHQGDKDFGRVLDGSAKTIIREVEALQKLVNDFSRFGKLPDIKKVSVNLSSLLREVMSLYSNFEDKIVLKIDDNLPEVEVDREQFKRAIINLIDNAISATKDGGKIIVEAKADPKSNRFFIEVADTGVGIDEKTKEKLFLPYFSTKKEGTGLGLAIVHRIVTEHGGSITVSDNIPKGSRFILELPIRG